MIASALKKPICRVLDYVHAGLARSSLCVRMAILVRNQCRSVIRHRLGGGSIQFERNGEMWLAGLVAPTTRTFIDVGANVGTWTEQIQRCMPPGGRGLVIDPSSYAIARLHERFSACAEIEVIQAAAADAPGEMVLYEELDAGETTSLVPGFSNAKAVPKTVAVTTVDAEVARRGWDRVDFLKIDAEGYDLHVLRGAARLLERQKVGVVQFEYNTPWATAGSSLHQAYRLLESCSYRLFLLRPDGLYDLDYDRYREYFDYTNYVAFAPDTLHLALPSVKGRI